ncbi:ribosome biogenesis atpase rix7, partial [Nannochloropsis gaditana CCMP526]|uniref:ribosome biogenesis atpase rix7 n=1 Tax=Nannochloropsis gaditana (strain CCMP526) TaxID=1093141 RepID=UPI00029F6B44
PHRPLRLADVFVQELRTFDRDKIGPALMGDGLRQQRLPAPGRPKEEDAGRDSQSQGEEDFRMGDGLQDGHGQLLAHRRQRPHVLPTHVGDGGEAFAFGRRLDLFQ